MGQFEAISRPIYGTFMVLNEALYEHYKLAFKAHILNFQGTQIRIKYGSIDWLYIGI